MATLDLENPKYFMDDPREAGRLDAKVDPKEFIDTFLASYLPADTGATLVDIGCGAGAIASAVAGHYTSAQVRGVDLSTERLKAARQKSESLDNITFMEGNIYDLPLEDNVADFIYTRFLLEYLKEPVKGIKEMYRVCKLNGMIMMQDLDGQLLSHYPETIENFDKVIEGMKATGFDPSIGKKLYHYGLQAGFKLEHIDIRPYHQILGKIDDKNDYLWDLKMEIALPQFEKILGSQALAQKFKDDFMAYLRDEETIMYSNLITVYLKKPTA